MHVECLNMHEVDHDQQYVLSCELILFGQQGMDIQSCLDDFVIVLGLTCPMCNETLVCKTTFVQAPLLLVLDLGQHILTINCLIHITCREGHQVAYNLKGVIYYANQHFTACVVTGTGQTWFHDSMFTGNSLLYDSEFASSRVCTQWWSHYGYLHFWTPHPWKNLDMACEAVALIAQVRIIGSFVQGFTPLSKSIWNQTNSRHQWPIISKCSTLWTISVALLITPPDICVTTCTPQSLQMTKTYYFHPPNQASTKMRAWCLALSSYQPVCLLTLAMW